MFVPPNQPLEHLFSALRDDERRLVMVVDEFGVAQGMFTLEDMLEELVGEIHDEIDKRHQVHEVRQGELIVKGTEELRTVEEHLAVYLSGKSTDTVNRWILNHVEHIPNSGERFNIDELEVLIEKASSRRIRRVHLTCPTHLEPNKKELPPASVESEFENTA
jgi:Mg2+/Co2+ transporter CorB